MYYTCHLLKTTKNDLLDLIVYIEYPIKPKCIVTTFYEINLMRTTYHDHFGSVVYNGFTKHTARLVCEY